MIGGSILALFTCYVYQMAFVSFSYGFNMTFNVTIGENLPVCCVDRFMLR